MSIYMCCGGSYGFHYQYCTYVQDPSSIDYWYYSPGEDDGWPKFLAKNEWTQELWDSDHTLLTNAWHNIIHPTDYTLRGIKIEMDVHNPY